MGTTELPASKKPIDVKWIFKLKLKPNGEDGYGLL